MVSVREAIVAGDLTAFEEVLAPDIVWVGLWPGQLCRNRDDVLEMLRTAQANGIEARPEIVRDAGRTPVQRDSLYNELRRW